MSFQDKYKEYRERQEAKKYFRSNNDQFLDLNQWLKVCLWGFISAIVCGVVLGLFISLIHITSSIFFIIAGVAIANIMTKVSGVESRQIAIVSVVFAFLSFVFMQMTMMYLPLSMMGIHLDVLSMIELFTQSVIQLFVGDIFTTLCVVIGLCFAYQQAQ